MPEYEKPLNLRHMTFKEVLIAVKERAKLTNEEIANRSGLDAPSVARYFSRYDDYLPSPAKVSPLCRAFGCTTLAQWFTAQVEDLSPLCPLDDPKALLQAGIQTSINNGQLSALIRQVIADDIITPEEAAQLQAKLRANELYLERLRRCLEPVVKGQGHIGGDI